MTIVADDLFCSCGHPVERIDGRTLVCTMCGKPKRLPYCVDCKHYQHNPAGGNSTTSHQCIYPVAKGLDLVTGQHIVDNQRSCRTFRQDEANKCSIRARFFERRDK